MTRHAADVASPALDVVTFGEALTLLVADRPGLLESAAAFDRRTAGAETNVAIGLSRLGLRVGWASRLGTDSMGRHLLGAMRREGVDCSHVVLDPLGRTGFMFKGRVTDGSDPPTEYHRAGSAASQFKPEQVDVDWLCRARHLHVTGVFPALSQGCFDATVRAMDATRAACKTVSFDPNLCPALWTSQALMCERVLTLSARAHWVLPGLQEGRLLTGQTTAQGVARALRARGADVVAVKLAAAGAYADSASWTGEVAGWPVAHVVDTVGAGDAFAVGLISALLDGRTLAAALTRGTWRGSLAVQVVGDTEGLPRRAQLDAAGL